MPKETISQIKQLYYICAHCKDEIFWNTHKKMVSCKCGKIFVDGCEDYVRVGGNKNDYKVINKHGIKN